MRNKIFLGLALCGMLLSVNSCENKVGLVPLATGLPVGCDTAKMTYSSGPGAPIQNIINTQCAVPGCHQAACPGKNYTSYAKLGPYISGGTSSQFWAYMFAPTSTPMPKTPQAGWDTCMKYQIKAWLLAGAPQ